MPRSHPIKSAALIAALFCFGASPALSASPPVAEIGQPEDIEHSAPDRNESKLLGKSLSLGGMGLVFVTGAVWAQAAWYDDPPNPTFEWNNDGWFGKDTYAGGSDKLGHLWANAFFVRATAGILELGGWSETFSTVVAASTTTAAFLLVEIKDAYYFAFSVGDLLFNLGGAALGVAFRHLPWLDDAIDLRVLYWPSEEFRDEGSVNFAEDYSGQTYLLAGHLSVLPVERSWVTRPLRYADVVLGYGARNFKPEPSDPFFEPRQELFVGVALNFQTLLDDLFFDGGRTEGELRNFARFGFEHLAIPGTTAPLATHRR